MSKFAGRSNPEDEPLTTSTSKHATDAHSEKGGTKSTRRRRLRKDLTGKGMFTTEKERTKKGSAHTGRRGGIYLSDIFI